MIDTIKLLFASHQFTILKPANFSPHADLIYKGTVLKAVGHKLGFCKACLSYRTNINGHSDIMLTIELSVPKLIFGNNVEELKYKDFDVVAKKLHQILYEMGIKINLEHIKHADVTAIHYAKNIKLTDGSTPLRYIRQIQQCNIAPRLDTNKTDYRNAGYSFKWHCNGYELIFYDKLYDIAQAAKSTKRSIDTALVYNNKILKTIRNKKQKHELLRMELRLNRRSKIKELFNKLHIKSCLTFKKLFKPAIMRKLLGHYMNTIEQKQLPLLNFKTMNDKALLAALTMYNPHIKPKQLMQYIGVKKLTETMTLEEIKTTFLKQHQRSWNRLLKEIELVSVPQKQHNFEIIRNQIKQYKPLRFIKSLS